VVTFIQSFAASKARFCIFFGGGVLGEHMRTLKKVALHKGTTPHGMWNVSGGGGGIEMLGKRDVTVLSGFIRHRIGTSDGLL
jgi:hypothetical protein